MFEPAAGGVARVGDVVADVLKRAGIAEQVERARVFEEWGSRVGDGIAAVTGPLRLDGSTLIVGVRSSAWLMELNLMKREILARLNEGRASARIEKLVFVLAELPGSPRNEALRGVGLPGSPRNEPSRGVGP